MRQLDLNDYMCIWSDLYSTGEDIEDAWYLITNKQLCNTQRIVEESFRGMYINTIEDNYLIIDDIGTLYIYKKLTSAIVRDEIRFSRGHIAPTLYNENINNPLNLCY
jgi:hypothetical protein